MAGAKAQPQGQVQITQVSLVTFILPYFSFLTNGLKTLFSDFKRVIGK
jgi:hypothetical protein